MDGDSPSTSNNPSQKWSTGCQLFGFKESVYEKFINLVTKCFIEFRILPQYRSLSTKYINLYVNFISSIDDSEQHN